MHRLTLLRGIIAFLMTALLLLIFTAQAKDKKSDWPQWRGPQMDGRVAGSGLIPHETDYHLTVRWKVPLGSAYSTVAIAGDRAITLYSQDGFDYMAALAVANGEMLWRYRIDSTFIGRYGSLDGPLSTPAIGAGQVFGLGPRGKFFALNVQTGEEQWSIDLPSAYGAKSPFYGFTTSPLLSGTQVFLQTGGENNDALRAFDARSGREIWSAISDDVQYQSPMLIEVDGAAQLVFSGGTLLSAVSPENGRALWRYRHDGSGGSMGAGGMNPILLSGNRLLVKHKGSAAQMLTLQAAADSFTVAPLWESKGLKSSYTVPVHSDGFIYGYSGTFLTCIDGANGKTRWKSRQPGDGFLSVADGHLVIATKNGMLAIARADSSAYRETARLQVFDGLAWASPSIAGGHIFVRSFAEIACIAVRPGKMVEPLAKRPAAPAVASGGAFADFLTSLDKAKNKSSLIDRYLAGQKRFPIIERDSIVHFIYRGTAEAVSLVGDLTGLDFEQPLQRVAGSDLFYHSMHVEPDARVAYGFVADFREAAPDTLNPQRISSFLGEMSALTMPGWRTPAHLADYSGPRAGRIDSVQFTSALFDSSRQLHIYLPPGYDANDQRYPVAYFHGAMGEDHIPNSLNHLIGTRVRPVIVVYIPRFFRGFYQHYIGTHRDDYSQLFIEEIIPFIDRRFRTISDRQSRASIGDDFGGFISFYSAFRHPDVIGKVGAHASYWDKEEQKKHGALLAGVAASAPLIYLDWNKYDMRSPLEGWGMGALTHDFARELTAAGIRYSGGQVNEGYGWVSYRNRTDKLFETLFPLR